MVATPRLLKMLAGKLPVGVLMPMIAGIGPLAAFAGRPMLAVIVKDVAPSLTLMRIVSPSSEASTVDGLGGFTPMSYSSRIDRSSARRQRHCRRDVMRSPDDIRKGSGKNEISGRAPNAGNGGSVQSAPLSS